MGTFFFDSVGFNDEVVKRMTEKEFIDHQMHENHYTRLSKSEKRKVLKKIFKLITGSGPDQITERRDE